MVHVALGGQDIDGRYQVGRARGVVAVGGIAVGFVAVGGVAVGLVSAGGVSVGLFAAVGGVAVAALAVGAVSLGVLAVGVVTSAAGVALAGARVPRALRAAEVFAPTTLRPCLPATAPAGAIHRAASTPSHCDMGVTR